MNGKRCDAMWADKAGLFRKMWAADPWLQRTPGRKSCWDVQRDDKKRKQTASAFFDETFRGVHCDSNWFEGNYGMLGSEYERPMFSRDAPALLGFDETIDGYCNREPKDNEYKDLYGDAIYHSNNCVAANINILSLCERATVDHVPNLSCYSCTAL